jgi:hypothetical protein
MSDNKIIFSGKGIVTKTYKQSLKVWSKLFFNLINSFLN